MLTVYTESKKDDILCVSIHPGWVKTDMGGDMVNENNKGALKPQVFYLNMLVNCR